MPLTDETLNYYKELTDTEKHYSWKNTCLSVPMGTMQSFIVEIETLREEMKFRHKVLIDVMTVFLQYTRSGNRCMVCGMVLSKGHTSDCKAMQLSKLVEQLTAGGDQ